MKFFRGMYIYFLKEFNDAKYKIWNFSWAMLGKDFRSVKGWNIEIWFEDLKNIKFYSVLFRSLNDIPKLQYSVTIRRTDDLGHCYQIFSGIEIVGTKHDVSTYWTILMILLTFLIYHFCHFVPKRLLKII